MKRTKAQRHNLHSFGAQKVKFQLLYLHVLHLNIACGMHHRVRALYLEKHQAPVVQRLDSAVHRINHYPADSVVCFVNTYPLDSDLSSG